MVAAAEEVTRVPDRVGPYRVLGVVGAGGEATVLEAVGPGGKVALKLLAPEHRGDPAWERRMERESQACAALHHPNLLELLDSGADAQHGPYLVTTLLSGQTLRELAADGLPPPAACLLLTPLLAGLETMHAQGFVHRDLKPENVMVTREGEVVLVDLGLSWHASLSRLTREGCVAGSVPYMSPEQIQGGPITPRCDVWSTGVMLYELIAGCRPFQRELPGEEVAAILAASYTPLAARDRRVSPGLSALVDDCLALDPQRRPADAGALRARLEQLEELEDLEDVAERDPTAELRALARDPLGTAEEIAEHQFARWRARAEAAIATGESFAALDAIDRALAYRGRQAELQPLIDRAAELDRRARPDMPSAWRQARRWLGVALLVTLPLALSSGLDADPPETAPPPAESASPLSEPAAPAPVSRETRERSRAAEKAFYQTAAGLVRFMGRGAKQRMRSRPDAGPRQRAADNAALEVVDGMADLFGDVGSDEERAPGVDVSPTGQEAAVKMLGGLLKLYTAGMKPNTERAKAGNRARRRTGRPAR